MVHISIVINDITDTEIVWAQFLVKDYWLKFLDRAHTGAAIVIERLERVDSTRLDRTHHGMACAYKTTTRSIDSGFIA